MFPGTSFSNISTDAATTAQLPPGNATLLQAAPKYVKAIMTPEGDSFDRLSCPALKGTRYQYLYSTTPRKPSPTKTTEWKYFFALDLTQCLHILPRLIGTIVETISFLGPENCALSIVEGHSTDGTYEVLLSLRTELEKLGPTYFFTTSDINPKSGPRIPALAQLRNLALQPLFSAYKSKPRQATPSTTILFISDIALCPEDLLELIHQRKRQSATMVCAMDWVYVGRDPTFYDVWVARGMNGDTFFNIPNDGNWGSAWNSFWNNDIARSALHMGQPFQVYSCWNGVIAVSAEPFLKSGIRFRGHREGECPQGEPKSLCQDLWKAGYGRIAVVPSVNVEYSDEKAQKIKAFKGYVGDFVENGVREEKIEWVDDPPEKVKCMPTYENQTWVDWDAPKDAKG
ncbi:MAG: hypothetical protein Q9220_001346 [cf. Caloplaca sp. 1 TL-2023]